MRHLYVLLIAVVVLSGCASQEKRLQEAAALCEKIGFDVGSDKFKECQHRAYESDTSRRAMSSAFTRKATSSQ